MKPFFLSLIFGLLAISINAQPEEKTRFEIAGYLMTDAGYNYNQTHPDYFDVMRPTQLPSYKNEFGTDGNVYSSVRQTFLGIKSFTPTKLGELKLHFAFDLFGVGNNAGQTTFHMLFAYAEIGMFGVGHTWSLFSDIGGYPNMLEYWGPVGMSLCKNVQFRFIPFDGKNRLAFALERPGATADEGVYADRIELSDVKARFNLPDFSAEYRITRDWGYAELAGIVRKIEWVDQGQETYDLSGKTMGWGLNFSTNLCLGEKDMLIGQTAYGEGCQNYMNDAPTDIAIKNTFDNPKSPIKGVTLPFYTYSVYLNHSWNEKFSSVIGYSGIHTNNTDGQNASAFRNGKYASTNLVYYPMKNIAAGLELQWISRKNYNDGWETSATKIQVSVRYSFSHIIL